MKKHKISLAETEDNTVVLPAFLTAGQLLASKTGLLKIVPPPVEAKVIGTKMTVKLDGAPTPDDFEFLPYKANFKSRSKPQILTIDTSVLQQTAGMAVIGLKFNKSTAIHIDGVFVDDGNQVWPPASIQPADANGIVKVDFSGTISGIMILFRMPTNKLTKHFEFFLTIQIQAGMRSSTLDCDPQVGNDPPAAP